MAALAAPRRGESRQAAHKWDKEADVVVIGSGAAGLPASIIAKENGASVILVEANRDIGGHAAVSTGNIPLGGGTKAQKDAGIVDSPDILFKDLTDWSVVESNGAALTASTTATSFALSPTTTFSPTTFWYPMELLVRRAGPHLPACNLPALGAQVPCTWPSWHGP